MKTEKLKFSNIKNVLSRAELKNIMAGSGGNPPGSGCGIGCFTTAPGYCPGVFCPTCVPQGGSSINGFCQ